MILDEVSSQFEMNQAIKKGFLKHNLSILKMFELFRDKNLFLIRKYFKYHIFKSSRFLSADILMKEKDKEPIGFQK